MEHKAIVINGKNIQKPKRRGIYGVRWDGTPTTLLTRLEDAKNFDDPVPSMSDDIPGSSPFDEIMPWCGMEEYNFVDNTMKYKKGDSEFSTKDYDTFVRIPKFWYKVVVDGDAREYYIANYEASGFKLHPAFYKGNDIYIGKYPCSASFSTRANVAPALTLTRAALRTGLKGINSDFQLTHITTWSAIQLLYLIEFADWNSSIRLANGITTARTPNNGETDSVEYHTGIAVSGTVIDATQQSFKYRNIENLYGLALEAVDGCSSYNLNLFYSNNRNYFIDDNSQYCDGVSQPMPNTTLGYITKWLDFPAAPWFFIPEAIEGSSNSFICDGLATSNPSTAAWFCCQMGGSTSFGASGFFAMTFTSKTADVKSKGRPQWSA